MSRFYGVIVAVWVSLAMAGAGQQAPAPAPAPASSPAPAPAPASVAAQPRPVVPVAASSVATNPDRFAGTVVSMTAAVVQRFGSTAFSVSQARAGTGKDILIVAPLLTAPVQPGAYVTVIGEVVKYDAAAVAARMKDAAPPPDVAAKYTGRPVVLASSVINESMTDLAKRPPPPMTPGELELNKAMKQVGPAFTALRQAVTASNTTDARDQAAEMSKGFTEAASFWKTQPHADAIQWTDDARKLADEISALAAKPDLDGLKTEVPKLQQICSNCHNQYRTRLDDGSYRYKDALPK